MAPNRQVPNSSSLNQPKGQLNLIEEQVTVHSQLSRHLAIIVVNHQQNKLPLKLSVWEMQKSERAA